MRRIAAHYIMPISGPVVRNGILTLSDQGQVLQLSEGGSTLTETQGVEFYSGMLVPGMVNVCLENPATQPDVQDVQRVHGSMATIDARMQAEGIVAAGYRVGQGAVPEWSKASRIQYCALQQEPYEGRGCSVCKVWLRRSAQASAVGCALPSVSDTPYPLIGLCDTCHGTACGLEGNAPWQALGGLIYAIDPYRLSTAAVERLSACALPLALATGGGQQGDVSPSMWGAIKTLSLTLGAHVLLPEILAWATLNGARALGLEASLGSFEVGKRPGVVLISHINHASMQLTAVSVSRRLV